jgi:hypothetical protein
LGECAILGKLEPPPAQTEPPSRLKAEMTASRRWLLSAISRADEIGLGAVVEKIALIVLSLAMLLAGCRGPNADAELGPNPGGGFQYGAEHGDNGSINPP